MKNFLFLLFLIPFSFSVFYISYSTYLGGSNNDYLIYVSSEGDYLIATGETISSNYPIQNPYQSSNAGGYDVIITKLNPDGTLNFSTYLGGSGFDTGRAVKMENGYIYVGGNTNSNNFPTQNPYQSSNAGGYDAFLTKFNPDGTLNFSTYLGGSGDEFRDYGVLRRADLEVENGTVYFVGFTNSNNFPITENGYQTTNIGGYTIFLTIFNPNCSLNYSTYLGGLGDEEIGGMEICNNKIYLIGSTRSQDFPVSKNAYDKTYNGNWDQFFTVINKNTKNIEYSTYLGGTGADKGYDLYIYNGRIYLAGSSNSNNFPLLNAYQSSNAGYYDGTLAVFDQNYSLNYSTYFGGSSNDEFEYITTNKKGIFLGGTTGSSNLPMKDAAYPKFAGGNNDTFLVRFSLNNSLESSTYYGGSSGYEYMLGGSFYKDKFVFVGSTASTDLPMFHSYDSSQNGGRDAFLVIYGYDDFKYLSFATYLGGTHSDDLADINEENNYIYTYIYTYSSDLPTLNAYDSTANGARDVLLTKFNPDGSMNYSTYLGGSDNDAGVVFDVKDGLAYLAGYTQSTNFPTTSDAYDSSNNGYSDAFLTIFNPDGTLNYSTYIGGSSYDYAEGISVSNDYIYLDGLTYSSNFPTTANAYDSSYNGKYDGFFMIFNSSKQLTYSTYLGGSEQDNLRRIVVEDKFAYLFGNTNSSNYPTTSDAYDSSYNGGYDFVFNKFIVPHKDLLINYSTYLGGSGDDKVLSIKANSYGFFVSGFTSSTDFPTQNAYQSSSQGNFDLFVSKFNPDGTLNYSTYLGGSGDEKDGKLESNGTHIFLIGSSNSTDFPTINAYQSLNGGGYDIVYSILNQSGGLIFSTYIGGSGNDYGKGIFIDNGKTFLIGSSNSSDFPTINAYDSSQNGGYDIVISEFNSSNALIFSTYIGGSRNDYGKGIYYNENIYFVGYSNSSNFPTTSNAFSNSLNGNYDGIYGIFNNGNLQYSTYLGGSEDDKLNGIITKNYTYIIGSSNSSNFPITSYHFSNTSGNWDIVYLQFNNSHLLYSTYLGGASNDYGNDIDVDDYVYIIGSSNSSDFPMVDAYDSEINDYEYTISVFSNKNDLVYSTYLGGSGYDNGTSISKYNDYVYVSGFTNSSSLAIYGGYDSTYNGNLDGYMARFKWTQNNSVVLNYSTYLGGSGNELADYLYFRWSGLDVYNKRACFVSYTDSANYPTLNPYKSTHTEAYDGVISCFNPNNTLNYSSYVGKANDDYLYDIRMDKNIFYITGADYYTSETSNAFSDGEKGGWDSIFLIFNNSHLISQSQFGGVNSDGLTNIDIGENIVIGIVSQSAGLPLKKISINSYQYNNSKYSSGVDSGYIMVLNRPCFCNSAKECNEKLEICNVVFLLSNISGTIYGKENKTLECLGNKIENTSVGINITENNFTINNCSFNNVDYGIYVASSNNSISYIKSNANISIYLSNSNGNIINNSEFYSNLYYGVYFSSSSNNFIDNIEAYNNSYGIYLYNSNNNSFYYLDIFNNSEGISFHSSSNNIIKNSNLTNNTKYDLYDDGFVGCNDVENTFGNRGPILYNDNITDGDYTEIILCNLLNEEIKKSNIGTVLLINSSNITIRNNTFYKYYGVSLINSNNNNIFNNNMTNNYSISFYSSSGNLIYNNILTNIIFSGTVYENYWNTTKIKIKTNIMNGIYLAGNYWGDCEDEEGICSNHTLNSNNIDYVPISKSKFKIYFPLNNSLLTSKKIRIVYGENASNFDYVNISLYNDSFLNSTISHKRGINDIYLYAGGDGDYNVTLNISDLKITHNISINSTRKITLFLNQSAYDPGSYALVYGNIYLYNNSPSLEPLDIYLDGNLSTYYSISLSGANGSYWNRRVPIYIKSPIGIQNYPILISLNYMNLDENEIRFTFYNNTETEIPYWVEEWPGRIWVKIPYLNKSFTTTIYLYYGNKNALNKSNGNEVFEFFDDFKGTSLNTSKWNINAVNTITYEVNNSFYFKDATKSGDAYWIYDDTDTGSQHQAIWTPLENFVIFWKSFVNNTANSNMGQGGVGVVGTDNRVSFAAFQSDGRGNVIWNRTRANIESNVKVKNYTEEEVNFTIIRNNSNIYIYRNDLLYSQMFSHDVSKLALIAGAYGGYSYLDYIRIPYVYVKKYLEFEPYYYFGTEESSFSSNSSGGYSFILQVPSDPGSYILKVNSSKYNYGQNNTTFLVSDHIPEVYINSPNNNSYLNDSLVHINVTVIDNNVNYTNITIYNASGVVNYTEYYGNGTFVVNLSVNDSIYNITATVYDNVSNSNSTTNKYITIDTQIPSLSILNPPNNSIIYSNLILINFTVSDENFHYSNISICSNGDLVNSTDSYSEGNQIVYLGVNEEGNYNITITSYDLADNSITKYVNITYLRSDYENAKIYFRLLNYTSNLYNATIIVEGASHLGNFTVYWVKPDGVSVVSYEGNYSANGLEGNKYWWRYDLINKTEKINLVLNITKMSKMYIFGNK